MSIAQTGHDASAESYRLPMLVTHLRIFRHASYFICPRCKMTMEREYMAYCDRCGQCLSWKYLSEAVKVK